MKLPLRCRVVGHDWRRQADDAGGQLAFCRRCGTEGTVVSAIVKFPGRGAASVMLPQASGRDPVVTG